MKLILESNLTSLIIGGFTIWLCICFAAEIPLQSEKEECPEKYGICNTCIKNDGVIVALTRIICTDYTQEQCLMIYNGPAGICDDGCNICTCLDRGISSTRMVCANETLEECLNDHPDGVWPCLSSMCICTKFGIRFIA